MAAAVVPDPHAERILILDFGSQYTQLIGRAVREAGVYCEIHSCELSLARICAFTPAGVILSAALTRLPKKLLIGHRLSCSTGIAHCLESATECRPWRHSWVGQ